MSNVLVHELRDAARSIASRPGFSTLVIGVLGIGLACVLFVMITIDGMLLNPLPFANPDRLYYAGIVGTGRYSELQQIPWSDLAELRRRYAGSAAVAGATQATMNLSDGVKPERYDGAFVTANLWRVLGVHPLLGRDFADADEVPNAAPTAMLSWSVWQNRYAGDPAIVGRQVRINTRAATVIGVMPENVTFPFRENVWQTKPLEGADAEEADLSYTAILRPRAGVTEAALRTTLQGWLADGLRANPARFRGMRVGVEPLRDNFVPKSVTAVCTAMLIAVLLVLLIACANTANLLLTRTLGRRQELAVRVALGASRARLALHLLAQSLVFALLASAIALPLAWLGSTWLDAILHTSSPGGPPLWMHFDHLSGRLVAGALAAALLTALIAGLLPALRAGGEAASGNLRDGARGGTGGAFARTSRWLVIGEIALSCLLLVCAGGLARGIGRLDHYDLGVATANRLTARVGIFPSTYPADTDRARYFATLIAKLRSDPEVIDATVTSSLPGFGNQGLDEVLPAGAVRGDVALPSVNTASVDERFLPESRIALLSGRNFDSSDRIDTPQVAIVDADFVKRYGDGSPMLGRRFRLDPRDPKGVTVTVVGVIPDLFLDGVGGPGGPSLLRPFSQTPTGFANLIVHTRGDPAAFAPRLTAIMRGIDADTPAYWVQSYGEAIRMHLYMTRVAATLFSVFGLVALALAAAGLYGVIAYGVGQRTREIGVRRALGAPDGKVLGNVLARSGVQLAIGLAIGVALGIPFAAMAARPMISEGFDTFDPLVLGGVVLVLALSAVLAAVVPARRALRVDPMVALRYE